MGPIVIDKQELKMKRSMLFKSAALLLAGFTGATAFGEVTDTNAPHIYLKDPTTADFQSAPGVPECTTFAVLHGDMASGPSTMMVRMLSGCAVPYQWHSASEELVLLKGEIIAQLMGAEALHFGEGSYVQLPSGRPHRFACISEDECVLFNVADSAFDIHFVDEGGESISVDEAMDGLAEDPVENW